jgi:nicotinamide mononucleotide transporter
MFWNDADLLHSIVNASGWAYIEWIGTILGLGGSLVMASNRISHIWAWGAWIISNILFISLFLLHTHQYGMLFMNVFGILTSSLGLWQWSKKKEINIKAMKAAFNLGKLGILAAIIMLIIFPIIPSLKLIEWFGSILSISGALLLASKHRKAGWSWIVWSISNLVLLSMTIYTEQWGVATLQFGFTISNIYGCIMWLYIKKPEIPLIPPETPTTNIQKL